MSLVLLNYFGMQLFINFGHVGVENKCSTVDVVPLTAME